LPREGSLVVDMALPERVPHPADRLDTLARVIRVINSLRDLDSALEILMDHLIELVGAERGFIMLVDPESGALEFRTARNFSKQTLFEDTNFQVSRSIVFRVFASGQAVQTSNAQDDERFQAAISIKEYGLRAVMCAPLTSQDKQMGVLYVDNRIRLGAFEDEDLDFLQTFADQAAVALERAWLAQESNRIRGLFSRYVSPEVVDEILARPSEALEASRRRVTVMFTDLRGFSKMAEELAPDELLSVLNGYYEEMGEIIFGHKGTVLSYLGDGLLAVFGAPLELADQEARAIRCAREMVEKARTSQGMNIGVGLATGIAVLGDLGNLRRREYTVLGDPVNTAARLEKLTKAKGHAVLADHETCQRAQLGGTNLGAVELPGKNQPVVVWAV